SPRPGPAGRAGGGSGTAPERSQDAPTEHIPKITTTGGAGAPAAAASTPATVGPGTGSTPPPADPPPPPTGGGGGDGGSGDGPEPDDEGKKGRSVALRWILRGVGVIALVMVLAVAGFATWFGVEYARGDVPQRTAMGTSQKFTMVASDDETVIAEIRPPEGNRTDIALSEVPEELRNAVIDAEDKDFYSNPGFSDRKSVV